MVASTIAVAAMFAYVATLSLPAEEGANIGAGVLLLWLLVAVALLGFGVRSNLAFTSSKVEGLHRPSRTNVWAKTAIWSSLACIVVPFAVPLPLAATAVSWRREPATRVRLVATGLTVLAVIYAAAALAFA